MASTKQPPVPKDEMDPFFSNMSLRANAPTQSSQSAEKGPFHYYAMEMKSLVQKIQDLRHLGIEDSRIVLPKICVVGDQSTGKSSLIEGISEIKVPRDTGTCTRCPMEINLSDSDHPWQCVIHIARRYTYLPDNCGRGTQLPTKAKPLGPWIESGSNEDEHFKTLVNKSEVREAIWLAQLAVLNPQMNSQELVPGNNRATATQKTALVKFSPNAVRLDISGPGLPNLSFYDLPGVISQTEHDGEKYLVRLVENLVKNYVSQKNCIVILTMPMTDDATNSSTARIIRDIQGAKERTLGVLTKPDRMSNAESFDQWIEILDRKKFTLGHGYFVIKNNPDPFVSHVQARMEEEMFFAEPPWNAELAAYASLFGTAKLQSSLSDLLRKQILGCLPSIIVQIDEKVDAINTELSSLPNPPTEDVQRILWGKTSDFEHIVQGVFDGNSSVSPTTKKPLQEDWNRVVMDFQLALLRTRPVLDMNASTDNEDLAEDSDCEIQMVRFSSKKRKLSVDVKVEDKPQSKSVSASAKKATFNTKLFDDREGATHRFTLEALSEIKIRSNTVGVPNQLDPRAIDNLNKKSIEHWGQLTDTFINALHSLVQETLLTALQEEFTEYHQTGLYKELNRILESYLFNLRDQHLKYVQDYWRSEHGQPFTMAQTQHQVLMKQAFETLKARRFNARSNAWLKVRGYDMTDEKLIADRKKKITQEDLGVDQYGQEIEMMASSLAYYEIARSRFLDVLCQSAHTKLIRKCRGDLVNSIRDELQIFGDNGRERCLELMAEDAERQNRRAFLYKEREKFAKAQKWISSLRNGGIEMVGSKLDNEF
ncbi:hypothetical protein N7508_001386 [Penicillium antarcticum]|uniref:uncharacterized protein n=1 Tax=Penicillium antarcticum TaxID=416450 RepID=UPI0023A0B6D1|nr:uncharacterized protein N7508_001386 [Penicillium antarcticum]KAJ5316878.1 hypothetical protein N7508_001386 [Penicillium antarcticum]